MNYVCVKDPRTLYFSGTCLISFDQLKMNVYHVFCAAAAVIVSFYKFGIKEFVLNGNCAEFHFSSDALIFCIHDEGHAHGEHRQK